MSCKVAYIEKTYRKDHPKVADELNTIYSQIWADIKSSNLFRKYGDGDTATYLFSATGTQINSKQRAFIDRINKKYKTPEGKNVIQAVPTKAGNNAKVAVNVHPLAQVVYNRQNPQTRLFQLAGETVSSKASPKTIAMVKDFLKRIGVDVKSVNQLIVNGKKLDANAVADITAKLIQVIDGKEDTSLPEEAMHFAVEIIEQTNPKLFNQLLKEINDYRMLKSVMAEYGNDPNYQTKEGKPDIRKLKKEAIAKVLTETIIKINDGVTEKPELLQKTRSWWKAFLDWFKGLIGKSGFDKAALDIISGKEIGNVDDIRAEQAEIYLQKSKQDKLYDDLKERSKTIDKRGEEGYYVDGKKTRRVTDIVKSWYDRIFAEKKLIKSDFQDAVDDLKKEKGTAGHKDFEYAFKLFIDEDGRLKSEEEIKDILDNDRYVPSIGSRDMYEILRDNLLDRFRSFPKGTRFMSEITVFDQKRNLAGTIDFLAITPEGKVSILDWKFMNLSDKYQDVPWYKVNAWNQQMEQYKLIIQSAYGINPQAFEQTRMIPIQAIYSPGNAKTNVLPQLLEIKIGDVNVKNITEDFLLPVGLETEKTGNKRIDQLLEKLNAIYKRMSEKKVSETEKVTKREQLNALFTAIRQLQMKQNIKPLLYQVNVLTKQIQRVINTYQDKFVGKDPKSFTDDEIDDYTGQITESLEALETYMNLDTELRFLFQGELTDEDRNLRNDLRDSIDNVRELYANLKDVDEQFTDEFVAGFEGVKDVSKAEKIVRGLSKWFGNTASIQLKSLQVLFKKANRAFTFAAMDTVTETKKLQTIKDKYDAWARSKGLTKDNYFDFIKKKDKNELIDEFNPEFYSTLKKKIQDKDYQWVRDNIDVDAYKAYLEQKKKEEYDRIDNKPDNIFLPDTPANEAANNETKRSIARQKAEIDSLYDVRSTESVGWLLYDDVKKFPNRSNWESAEWKQLNAKGNEAAKEFYDYIKERNDYYMSIGYINAKQARTFLPWVRRGLAERLIFGGKMSLGEQFLRNISIDEGDVGYGQINPLTGKPIDKIPKYFTTEVEGEISTDLFRTMALYNEMAIKFKYLTNIEEQGRALIRLEKNKKAIATSYFGKTIYEDGILKYNPDNSENAKLVEDMVKAIVYQQKFIQSETFDQVLGKFGKFGEKVNDKLGFKLLPENLEGRQMSINKVVNQLNNTFQLQALGLNVLSSMSNLFGGTTQSLINSGKYFTKSDFVSTEMWLLGRKIGGFMEKKKAIAAMDYFLPFIDNYNRDLAKKLSLSKLSQENVQEFLMVLMRNSDKAVQAANFYSYLKNTIVMDGEVVNVREYLRTTPEYENMYQGTPEQRKEKAEKFEEDVKKLVEEKGVLNVGEIVDNEFVIPGVDRKSESVVELRRKVQSLTSDALGSMSEANKRLINLNIYGNSFMVFKNWIPRLVDVRLGNLKYNSASDAYEWGRMRMMFRIISEDFLGSIGNLRNSLIANDKGVDFLRQLYEKKKADYENDTGKELEMTEEQFIDLVRQNIKNQLLDVLIYGTLFAVLAALKANAPDDDEDEIVKNQYKFLLKATDKFKDEIGYFYDPTSITGLVSKGVFPSLNLIDNYKKVVKNFLVENYALATGDEKLADETQVIKYLMRSFPITSQAAGLLPMFYPNLAKDLGIRMQQQYGIR